MGMSLSTLDRRISAGQLMVRRDARGQRHRVYVVVEDDVCETNGTNNASTDMGSGNTQLAVARERIRGLEAQVELLREQLGREQNRNAELFNQLKEGILTIPSAGPRRAWWRFW